MSRLISERNVAPFIRRLYLPAYQVREAARYVGTNTRAVTYWYYGGGTLGPALPGRKQGQPLSYLELVEVAFVAHFRMLGVSLQRLRSARQYVAQSFNSEFPFAEFRFKTEGSHLFMNLAEVEPDSGLRHVITADRGGQLGWANIIAERFEEFDYEQVDSLMLASKWHPAGRESAVVIDPRVSFGAPNVGGVPTWALKGRYDAGETIEDMLEDFPVNEAALKDALAFEGVEIAA